MHKKLIISLCAVTLLSLGGAAIGPATVAIHADSNQLSTTAQPKEKDSTFAGTIDLVDKAGKVLGQTSVLNGKYGDHVAITLPTGYVSADNGATTIDYVLNKERKPICIQKLAERLVSRIIKIHRPDGVTVSVMQSTTADGLFAAYKVPEFKYYRPSAPIIPAAKASDDKDKVLEVSYTRTLPDWAIGVDGYTVITAGTISRTINFVDESGKIIAPSKVQTVKREILVKDNGLSNIYGASTVASQPNKVVDKSSLGTAGQTIEQAEIATANKLSAAKGFLVLEIHGKNANIVAPAYKLNDVTAPTIKGMKVKNAKQAKINNQYLWLSEPHTLAMNPVLDNGLHQFLLSDTTINVVYTKAKEVKKAESTGNNYYFFGNLTNPDTAKAKDATKDKDATKTQDPAKAKDATKTQDPAKTQDATKGKDAAKSMTKAQDPAKAKIANGKTLPNGTGSMGVTTGSVLPQTGNRPNNWLILAAGAALAALGLGFADKFSKQKDSRN